MNILSYLQDRPEGAELMDTMIDRLGLSGAMAVLADHDNVMHRAAHRCSNCGNVADCATWLATAKDPKEAPDYCENHDLFERVKARISAHPL